MHISEILKEQRPNISFEFFPPKSEKGSDELFQTIQALNPLRPSYVSVTYGAGGTTRGLTQELVGKLHRETKLTVIPHLTCVGHSKSEIHEILRHHSDAGIENVMALRGDPPAGKKKFEPHPEGLKNATELVKYIRKEFPQLGIGVAGFPEGHPETPNRQQELDFLKAKVDAGADYICTQLFFENRDYFDYRERCELVGVKVPIIAGIMPVTSLSNMSRIAELALGARFPARLLKALLRVHSDDYAQKVGIHWASEQVRDLIDNDVMGIHFYTLNKSKATMNIYENLGIRHSEELKFSKSI
jgi:methylenetetrahydrofolate reductase (NADPH)